MLEAMLAQAEYDAMSDQELLERANRFERDAGGIAREPELLGEFTAEEAAAMGAFFDDPSEEAAFNALVARRAGEASAA